MTAAAIAVAMTAEIDRCPSAAKAAAVTKAVSPGSGYAEALEAHQEEENDVAVRPDHARYGLTQRLSSVELPPRLRGEVVKQCVRVGLGPHTDATGTTERAVERVDPLRAVPVHLHMIPLALDTQLVPDARCDLPAPVGELDPASVFHVVEADVVLQRIRAREVIVVLILVPEHETARPVNMPRHRLAFHRDADIREARRQCGRDREPEVGTVAVDLGEDVRRTRRV